MFKHVSGKLYGVFDTVSGHFIQFGVFENDGLAVRSFLLTFRVPLKDCEVYCFGDYKTSLSHPPYSLKDCEFKFLRKPRLVSWDSYKFPETVAEALAPLKLSPDEIAEISKSKIKETING